MRIINADELEKKMYHEAFENDVSYDERNPMARWDSGLWIRYKMFENCLENTPTIDAADRPQGDSVSRRYLLAEIDDLADEFFEVDENGLHSERWCGILDSKGIIVNAPSVSDRPQGEWMSPTAGSYIQANFYKCSICGKIVNLLQMRNYKYCPNCGARMKG